MANGLQTSGFGVSTLSKAPDLPTGKIDVGAIYDRAKQGLELSEAIQTSGDRTRLLSSNARTQIARNQAEQSLIPGQTEASAAQSRAITEEAPLRTSLLSSNAQTAQAQLPVAQQGAKVQLAGYQRQQQYVDQAAKDYPKFQKDYEEAISLADYGEKADALNKLSIKYPWLPVLYKDSTAADINKVASEARTAHEKSQQRETDIDKAEILAKSLRGTGTAGLVKLLQDEGYDADVINGVINKQSATAPKDPNAPTGGSFPGLLRAREELIERRTKTTDLDEIRDLDKAIDSVDAHIKLLNTPKAAKKDSLAALTSLIGGGADKGSAGETNPGTQFEKGKTYVDAQGRKATFDGEKFVPVP